MATKNKLLTALSDAEQFALYGLPDFDEEQRLEFLSLSEAQLGLGLTPPGCRVREQSDPGALPGKRCPPLPASPAGVMSYTAIADLTARVWCLAETADDPFQPVGQGTGMAAMGVSAVAVTL